MPTGTAKGRSRCSSRSDGARVRAVVEDQGSWQEPSAERRTRPRHHLDETPDDLGRDRARGERHTRHARAATGCGAGGQAAGRSCGALRTRGRSASLAPAQLLFKPTTDILTEPLFELHSSLAGETLVVAVTGEIDMATAPELAKAIDAGGVHGFGAARGRRPLERRLPRLVRSERTRARPTGAGGARDRLSGWSARATRPCGGCSRSHSLTGPLGLVDSLGEALA